MTTLDTKLHQQLGSLLLANLKMSQVVEDLQGQLRDQGEVIADLNDANNELEDKLAEAATEDAK